MFLIANGGITDYPKNTKESVTLSKFDETIDGVLIDVRITNDGKLILYENDRIFGDKYISKMNYQDIMKINIKKRVSNYYIPLLEEILFYYPKDILIIRLHHNYDNNEKIVTELKKVLNKYDIKRKVVVTNNDNLYDYLNMLTNYEVYHLDNNDNISTIDVIYKNHNSNSSVNFVCDGRINVNNELDSFFILTNNCKVVRGIYKI